LKQFGFHYAIDGKDGFDPDSFMNSAKKVIVSIIESNRQTEVKVARFCIMERT